MTNDELKLVLEEHRKWIAGEPDGKRAALRGADLRGADLSYANLREADLRGAALEFSAWPLCGGSLNVKIDKRLACQLMYHALRAMQSVDDPEVQEILAIPAVVKLANKFHRADECGEIQPMEGKK